MIVHTVWLGLPFAVPLVLGFWPVLDRLLLVEGPLVLLVLWIVLDAVLVDGPLKEVVGGAVMGMCCGGVWLFL